jgi:hypothetical protein
MVQPDTGRQEDSRLVSWFFLASPVNAEVVQCGHILCKGCIPEDLA